ncbi:ribonuclease J [Natronospora cellulosivora (SeqCode)]
MEENKVSIISLGGRGEVGNNMIVLENKEDIIILDAGVLFPDEDKYGIDLIIPDISYLLDRKDKIRAMIFSHGHEDHIGAIPYIFELINPPLYGTDLTIGLIESKLEDAGLREKAELHSIGSKKNYERIKLNSFEIEFCHVNHSIPGCVAMGIRTDAGLIVYTGDYKFDQTPVSNPQTDYEKLASWGQEGVLALLGDSTNSEHDGHTLSEMVVSKALEESFRLNRSRIIIATFSSNVERIQQIANASIKSGRKMAINGRSMANTIGIARDLNYLDFPDDLIVSIEEANKLAPEKVVLLMTGSQGEYRAALSRVARGEHRSISIKPGDTIYLSSSPIPGNEKAIGEIINQLYSKGAEVMYGGMLDLHASGHACQEEIKMMINLTKPKFVIPVHGEFRHLHHHAQLAKKAGIPKENIVIAINGDKIDLSSDSAQIVEQIETGELYIEGRQISDTGDIVLNDRRRLSENGFFNIFITMDSERNNLGEIKFLSRGFVYNKESNKLINQAKEVVNKTLEKSKEKNINDLSDIKKKIYESLNKYFYEETNRSPLILIEIIELAEVEAPALV